MFVFTLIISTKAVGPISPNHDLQFFIHLMFLSLTKMDPGYQLGVPVIELGTPSLRAEYLLSIYYRLATKLELL